MGVNATRVMIASGTSAHRALGCQANAPIQPSGEMKKPHSAFRTVGPWLSMRLLRLPECLPELLGCNARLSQHTTEGANGEFVV